MTEKELDLTGLECPEPTLKIGVAAEELEEGDTIIAEADCDTFPDDVEDWCDRQDATLVSFTDEGDGVNRAEIQL
ncbi:MAG: sulfurtransferase TusA family protein [Candidatus Nanohaloarchaea archaeon]